MKKGAAKFFCPTIAAAAIAMLFPLTALRTLKTNARGYTSVNPAEVAFNERLSQVIWVMVVVWIIVLVMPFRPDLVGIRRGWLLIRKIAPIILSAGLCGVAMFLNQYKEKRW